MRIGKRAFIALAIAISAAACEDEEYAPSEPPGDGGGGLRGSVMVGSGIQFASRYNGTKNPAVDTVPLGGTVTWTWSGALPHSVRSVGAPGFTSSVIRTGNGTFAVTFNAPGTYHYDCAVHGQAMSGRVVVLDPGPMASTVNDPAGDTFGTVPVKWDLTAMTVERDAEGVTATLVFSKDVVSPATGDPSGVIAVLDLDLDQNSATGILATTDALRTDGGSTGLGDDARVNLVDYADDGSVPVVDAQLREMGRVTPVFAGRTITIRIPRLVLRNDDGFLNAAAVVGIFGGATDIAPQNGHLRLSPFTIK